MNAAKHTPTPYSYGRPGIGSDSRLIISKIDEDGFAVARICEVYAGHNEEANAEFVVRACNAHDGLLRRLQDTNAALANWARLIHSKGSMTETEKTIAYNACEIVRETDKLLARAAIAKATGQPV